MNYLIKDITLTAIGDAVRAKGNTEDKILVSDLATAISNLPTGGGEVDIPKEAFLITGDCSYAFTGKHWKNIFAIDNLKNKWKSENITNCDRMIYNNDLKEIPFSISTQNTNINANYFISNCGKLEYLPELSNTFTPNTFERGLYNNNRINSIPNSWVENFDMSVINSSTSAKNFSYLCYNHYSLRNFPKELLKRFYDSSTAALSSSNSLYYSFFYNCYSLDEVVGIPVYGTLTTNRFGYFCLDCSRVKEIMFTTNEDGTPKTANWKSQTIDLTNNVGYAYISNHILYYNSGITADKEVKDDATYQALKNDPDWWTTDINYSRYNHDSAVNTINSLPDTSAYLATATGTNTIKFKGASGALTDGGAINTLTEEEIAVATSKGWTVSLV